jgi:hypothetical protein
MPVWLKKYHFFTGVILYEDEEKVVWPLFYPSFLLNHCPLRLIPLYIMDFDDIDELLLILLLLASRRRQEGRRMRTGREGAIKFSSSRKGIYSRCYECNWPSSIILETSVVRSGRGCAQGKRGYQRCVQV